MAERRKRSTSHEAAEGGPIGFRSLVVPLDLTPGSDRILGRVALLPLAEDARITLLHVVPGTLAPRDQKRAESDAKKALTTEARHLSKALPRSVRIEAAVEIGRASKQIAERARTVAADLIVMGRGGGRALRDAFLGSTAERVIRRGQVPVLVVRLPARATYARPMLALDLDEAAHAIVHTLLRAFRPPRPPVTLVHALQTPYAGMVYPSLAEDQAEERRRALHAQASLALADVLGAALARAGVRPEEAPHFTTRIRQGGARAILPKAVAKAETDLLVLGTHGHAGAAHAFLGTVAGDVLRAVTCDVLVVPPRAEPGATG